MADDTNRLCATGRWRVFFFFCSFLFLFFSSFLPSFFFSRWWRGRPRRTCHRCPRIKRSRAESDGRRTAAIKLSGAVIRFFFSLTRDTKKNRRGGHHQLWGSKKKKPPSRFVLFSEWEWKEKKREKKKRSSASPVRLSLSISPVGGEVGPAFSEDSVRVNKKKKKDRKTR